MMGELEHITFYDLEIRIFATELKLQSEMQAVSHEQQTLGLLLKVASWICKCSQGLFI
jgi:hypothetical protein